MPQMYPAQSWYTNRDACDLPSMLLMEVVFSLPQKSLKKNTFSGAIQLKISTQMESQNWMDFPTKESN